MSEEGGINQSSPQGSKLRMKRISDSSVESMNDDAILELAKKDLTKILKLKVCINFVNCFTGTQNFRLVDIDSKFNLVLLIGQSSFAQSVVYRT